MTKARILANLISDNAELADGQISVAEVVGAAPTASPTFTGTPVFSAVNSAFSTDSNETAYGRVALQIHGADNVTNDINSAIVFSKSGGRKLSAIASRQYGDADQGGLDFYTQPSTAGSGATLNLALNLNNSGFMTSYSGAVFNEDGEDADFRVKSDGNANMLFVDAGNDKVGVGTNTLQATMHVFSGDSGASVHSNANELFVENSADAGITIGSGNTSSGSLRFADDGGTGRGIVYYDHSNDNLVLYSGGSERVRINSTETVFNEDSADTNFRVESDSNANAFVVDAGTSIVSIGAGSDVANNSQPKLSVTAPWKASSSTDYDGTLSLVAINGGSSGGRGSNIIFTGEDGASARTFAKIDSFKENSTSGDHDGALVFRTRKNGSGLPARLHLLSYAAIFNDDSDDTDFIVESDSNANAIFMNAGNGTTAFGTTTDNYNHASNEGIYLSPGSSSSFTANSPPIRVNRNGTGGNDRSNIELYNNGNIRGWIGSLGAEDGIFLYANGSDGIHIYSDEVVVNQNSSDLDFRVQSDNDTHMIYVDAASNAIGFGDTSPFDTSWGSTANTRQLSIEGTNYAVLHLKGTSSPTTRWAIGAGLGKMYGAYDDTNANHHVTYNAGSSTVFNDDSKNLDFRVESDANANMFTVDGGNNITSFGKFGSGGGIAYKGAYFADGGNNHFHLAVTNNSGTSTSSNIYVNRQVSDGQLITFRQANSNEGNISVSGSTVSYNGFSGRHESSGIPTNTPIGTVVSTIDALDVYPDTTHDENGNVVPHGKAGQTRADHPKVEVSSSEGDSCVYGIVSEFDDDGKLIVTSVGIGSVRVTGSCAKGDLLESNGDGTAKVQSDDIIRSKTIGKVTIGNTDTGVKLVSCVMYCG
jgi:hypothetical protein